MCFLDSCVFLMLIPNEQCQLMGHVNQNQLERHSYQRLWDAFHLT